MSRIEGKSSSGKGGINEVAVNSEGEAEVFAVSELEIEHVSEKSGLAFSWCSDIVDIDANDTVLLVKNTSTDMNLHIEEIAIDNGSVASEYTIHLPTTEVTPTGTALTGVSLNTALSEVAEATAKSDETNNAQGNVIRTVFVPVDGCRDIATPGIILGKNKSVAVDVVADTSESSVTIIGFFKEK